MAGVLYCTLNAVWARNRNHCEDSKSVSTITQTDRDALTRWDRHLYFQKQWPKREPLIRQKNVCIDQPSTFLCTSAAHQNWTHKISAKVMDQESAGFMYFKNKLPRVSDAKIKEGVLVGPQIRELIQDVKF
jgi:hypothetical protein